MKLKCIDTSTDDTSNSLPLRGITLLKYYDIVKSNDVSIQIVCDTGDHQWYSKHRFQSDSRTAEHIAYDKITSREEFKTTDGSTFVISDYALKHQMMLDVKSSFVGIVFGSNENPATVEQMLAWAKAYPDSLEILNKLCTVKGLEHE